MISFECTIGRMRLLSYCGVVDGYNIMWHQIIKRNGELGGIGFFAQHKQLESLGWNGRMRQRILKMNKEGALYDKQVEK
jgi:hypothetical protein